jgi:hypothetical protein
MRAEDIRSTGMMMSSYLCVKLFLVFISEAGSRVKDSETDHCEDETEENNLNE